MSLDTSRKRDVPAPLRDVHLHSRDDGRMSQSSMPSPLAVARPPRVLSIDVLRGITIALMILVNDPGDWKHVFKQLDHADWNGWTLTDLVFPTFLFLMGASMFLSIEKRENSGDCKKTLAGHIALRSAKIFLLDLILAYFPRMHWSGLRLFGVLTRIALCSFLGGLILLGTRKARNLAIIIASLLLGYWILMRFVPVPGAGIPGRDIPFMDETQNLAAWIDRGFTAWTQRWLHAGTLYNKVRDPEGLLSSLPAVATTLLGSMTGMWMRHARMSGSAARMRGTLAVAGAAGFLAGEIWARWFPINKNLWTSSYVLLAAGLAALVLAFCSWLVDDRPHPWTKPFRFAVEPWLIFGSNSIIAFTTSVVLVKALIYFKTTSPDGTKHALISSVYHVFARNNSTEWTSLAYAVCFVLVCFLPNLALWHRKVFFRL